MPDPLTTNKSLAQPTRGSDTGVWDTPMNANSGIIDNSFGATATVALTNSNVSLSSGQYQCAFIKLTGALTANCTIIFPSGIGSFYDIINQTTNSSNFVVLANVSGGNSIGLPPGANTKILIDGTNPQYSALPHHVGGYWDHGGSSLPLWVSQCTVPPYLKCDGSTFSAGTYPALAAYLGGTTLPDARGRIRMALDEGTGRLTNITAGIGQSGGEQNHTLNTGELPVFTPSGTIGGSQTVNNVVQSVGGANLGAGAPFGLTTGNVTINGSNFSFTGNSIGSGSAHNNVQPAYFGGITMIRAG